MTRNTIAVLSLAGAAVAGWALLRRSHRRPREFDDQTDLLRDVSRTRPAGGRSARRRAPHADGHATPAAGPGRISTAPKFYTHKG